MKRVALIPGDGIGIEVTRQAARVIEVLRAGGEPIETEEFDFGADRYLRTGVAITNEEMARLGNEFDAIFLGAIGDPRVEDNAHARAILLGLRFSLDLFINLRPVRLFDPALSPLRDVEPSDIDMVIFRENTEGVYVGMGGLLRRGTPQEVAIQEDINTRFGVERIVRAAFEFARARGRSSVTLTDKANAMPHAGDLWRRVFKAVAGEYPEIGNRAVYADALALDLVLNPARYDVIVAPNLFGDLLSDLAAAIAGGLGIAPSANLHPGRPGLYEPVHGSAPDIAGTNRANPLAAILTVALMLENLGLVQAARRVEAAVEGAIRERRLTPDLGGTLGTEEVGEWVCERITDAAESMPLQR
jgi:3-isopropylmalate dehydrogenase